MLSPKVDTALFTLADRLAVKIVDSHCSSPFLLSLYRTSAKALQVLKDAIFSVGYVIGRPLRYRFDNAGFFSFVALLRPFEVKHLSLDY